MKISLTGSLHRKNCSNFPFFFSLLAKGFRQQRLIEAKMRNHSNNLILLGSKMKTVSSFSKTIGFSLPLRNKQWNITTGKYPKFRCIGKIYSSLSKTAVTPTEMAS
jgi:hypothetical protein